MSSHLVVEQKQGSHTTYLRTLATCAIDSLKFSSTFHLRHSLLCVNRLQGNHCIVTAMSRICVKSLPEYVSEDRLRELFSQKGEITDCKLMRTKDGKSRQFAFIGFRSEQEAQEAIKYFDNNFLDTRKITCEIAREVGDLNLPRPWSRHSLKKEEKVKEDADIPLNGGKKGRKRILEKDSENDDPQLQEFLQVMQPRVKSKMWSNDTLIGSVESQKANVSEGKNLSSDNGEEQLAAIHSNVSNKKATKSSQKVAHNEVISDMDYFKSKVKKEWSDSDIDENVDVGNNDEDGFLNREHDSIRQDASTFEVEEDANREIFDRLNPSSSTKVEQDEDFDTCRLFVRNLPYTTTDDELKEHFSKYGNVSEVQIVVDKVTKRSKGIAYIIYTLPESASRAIAEGDISSFQGRLLHVIPARFKKTSEKQETGISAQTSKTLKQQRVEDRKVAEASGDTKAWNSLFMRPDTVVENIARKLGVSKSDLLDREADDLAVRIALGETQVIAETKKALSNSGINISCLEDYAAGKTAGVERSNHVLLVKNLPFNSSEGELAKMFGKFGSLDKIILPPTKILAVVVFLESSEASAAFKGLAYKRYKSDPLYLEWAPSNILDQNPSKSDGKNKFAVGENDAKRLILEQQLEGIAEEDADPDRVESRSLFVKNLNFKTSDDALRKHFNEHVKEGKILSVKVKKHLKNGKNVSMGFGFIEFDSVETAGNVCRDLQGTVLDGHALILQLCRAKRDEQVMKRDEKDKSSTKLLVKNVAFEATEKDLRRLFSPFGQIKSLRLPMKFGNHRGFAFVEYVTKQEAQNAMKELSHTHLYGRHLVLQSAKEGESIEELRKRTAAQFSAEQSGGKLSKKAKQIAVLDEDTMKFKRIAD